MRYAWPVGTKTAEFVPRPIHFIVDLPSYSHFARVHSSHMVGQLLTFAHTQQMKIMLLVKFWRVFFPMYRPSLHVCWAVYVPSPREINHTHQWKYAYFTEKPSLLCAEEGREKKKRTNQTKNLWRDWKIRLIQHTLVILQPGPNLVCW